MVRSIYEAALTVPFYTIEDAFFVGEIAVRKLNYTLYNNRHFRTYKATYLSPCFHK